MKVVFSFLDEVPLRAPFRVSQVGLDPELVAWLKAVGIEEGTTLEVLRRGIFGGPLHVRTSLGCELAVHRAIAKGIRVEKGEVDARGAAASGPDLDLAPLSASTAA